MPAPPLPSLLITPDLRRQLQQRYEEARRLSAQPRPDFRRIHALLVECLRADPGNLLYLDALFANLRRRDAAGVRTSWWTRWWRGRQAAPGNRTGKRPQTGDEAITANGPALGAEYSVLREAPDALWNGLDDVHLLRKAASAADACDLDEAELRYLEAARQVAADDVETLRMLARALTRQGRFEDALGPWFAVLALAPNDGEAEQAIEDLRGAGFRDPAAPMTAHVPAEGSDAAALLCRARSLQAAGDFRAAEHCLTQAQAASGGDLGVLLLREELRIRQSEERVAIASRRATRDLHRKAQLLVNRLKNEHNRIESEILNARAERLPGDAEVRVELAQRLKQAGNFSGAIQRLEEALRLRPGEPAALIELGECWQHLRQFAKALDIYEQAIASAESSEATNDLRNLARYRAAVLAAGLGKTEQARQHFVAILATDSAYRDARMRLDNLGPN